MLEKARTINIVSEFEQWSKPEAFWDIRKDRKVRNHESVMKLGEKLRTAYRILKLYGIKGVYKIFENEKNFYKAILNGESGYALFKGIKRSNL